MNSCTDKILKTGEFMIFVWAVLWAASSALAYYFCAYRFLPEMENGGKKITKERHGIAVMGLCSFLAGSAALIVFSTQDEVTLIAILKIAVVFSVLAIIVVTDVNDHIIPNYCSIVLVAARGISFIAELFLYKELAFSGLLSSVISASICLCILMVSYWITHGGIGYGDIKFFSALGFLCGIYTAVFTMLFSMLFCAVVSCVLLLTKKKTIRDSIPMGPFIMAGFYVVVILGVG